MSPRRSRPHVVDPFRRRALGLVAAVVVLAGGCSESPRGDGGAGWTNPVEPAPTGAAVVSRHIDGDSLEIEVDGQIVEVRLIGINAPELADCAGPAASDALAALLDGGPFSVIGEKRDTYGRRLVELVARGVDVNAELVRTGWALAVHGDGNGYVAAAGEAAAAGVGLWARDAGSCRPRPERVVLVDATANPPGPDEERLNEELVVIENQDPAPVDLDGWILRDESTGNRLTLPRFELGPGERVAVHTGCGADGPADIYWCSRGPVWSNGGDTALLLGPDGAYVSHLAIER